MPIRGDRRRIRRGPPAPRSRRREDELGELLELFARGVHILFAAHPPELKVVHADPDDDKFIACAVALKAELIITGDKALRDIGNYMGIRILGPREFLEE